MPQAMIALAIARIGEPEVNDLGYAVCLVNVAVRG